MSTNQENADRLLAAQAVENDGRGVNCVRGVSTYLGKLNNYEDANQAALTDYDKIRNFPKLVALINEIFPNTVEKRRLS